MSLNLGLQSLRMHMENSVQPASKPLSKPSSARSTPSQTPALAPARAPSTKNGDDAKTKRDSNSHSPSTTPPLKPRGQGPQVPPPPAAPQGPKPSPRLPQPEVKARAPLSGANSSHSRSPSASSTDSDDDFVYILDSVKTTEEAVERIRAVQQPKERSLTTFFTNGLTSSTTNLVDLVDAAPKRKAQQRTAAAPRKMKGGLPATMEEFYECPRYTVSLTAAREAIFSDALSGFHSYVERERAQREQLRALQRSHSHSHPHHQGDHPSSSRGSTGSNTSVAKTKAAPEKRGSGSGGGTHALPSFAGGSSEEWNTALAAAAPPPSEQSAPSTTHAAAEPASSLPAFCPPETKAKIDSTAPPSETASTPVKSTSSGQPAPETPPLTCDAVNGDTSTNQSIAATSTSGKDAEGNSQHLSASYMFIMRSRDTEAMSPVSSPRANAQGTAFGKASPTRDEPAAQPMPALELPSSEHVDPVEPTVAAAPPPSKPASAPNPEAAAKLEEMQLETLLKERIYQRTLVPVVFRCRYALDFAETIEEHKRRVQLRDRVLRESERAAGPVGTTHAMRQRIRERYADPNTVAAEWPYVWEQFERDIPRETLFIADTPYHDAQDALAAIMSYVEYCYDRGQQHIKERSEQVLADARKERTDEVKDDGRGRQRGGRETSASPPPPPPPPKSKGFFESIFSAGSAAIKEAVVTVRASLPDFVGDPLLSLSGLDPALYHASLLFPADPKARSEKIFTAVREVVLASQQSFMGFPYQLLCEQVGTERLGLALEALEMDQDDDDDEEQPDTEAAAAAATPPPSAQAPDKGGEEDGEAASGKKRPPPLTVDASAPIPIHRGDESEMKREVSSGSLRSPMPNSRVVRIYQSFSSPTMLTDNPDSRRRRGHTPHVIDEWNVSSSSSHASDIVCSPFSTEAAKETQRAREDAEEPTPTWTPGRPPPLRSLASELQSATPGDAAPPPPAPAHPAPAMRHNDGAARRRRERRRRRRSQLPLLVGEPRPHEFAAFLDIIRARVAAKTAKAERKERERQRRERVQRLVERQREQWHSLPSSRAASSTSLDVLGKAAKDASPAATASPAPAKPLAKPSSLFREDVEGSAYLLPTQPALAKSSSAATAAVSSPLSNSFSRLSIPPETRGMRICLFFDEKRNVPTVVVNKLFRLFTMPGVRGLTSSEEEEEEEENGDVTRTRANALSDDEEAALRCRDVTTSDLVPPRGAAAKTKCSEKSLLLLIQVQFSLFTKEEAEVRWKWWKV